MEKTTVKETYGKFEREKFMLQLLGEMVFIPAFYRQHEKPTVLMTDGIVKTPAVQLTPR